MALHEEKYSMITECTDKYEVIDCDDGGIEIYIKIPKRFKDLWLIKLTDLYTTDKEIKEYEVQ